MSEDYEDAQLMRRIEPNSRMGPVLAVRAFALEQDGLAPEGFKDKRGRQGVCFTLVNPLDPRPDPQFEAYKHVKNGPWRDLRIRHEGSTGNWL